MPSPDGVSRRLRVIGLPLVTAASVLVVCGGGFLGFVLVVVGGMSDPAPDATPDQYGPYWPEVLAGVALTVLSLGALIWFSVLGSRNRRRPGLIGLSSLAILYILGLLVLRLT
ncbi:hypothetical protein [Peterkaempfera griseoplana]|uniref:hypothetical protein n=1 Tax=Peterkaempfera griseoplana TaxID=66896 RepID=UPI0006E3E873|nr:hypothetical protein [Peterkaempfera griseoplana]